VARLELPALPQAEAKAFLTEAIFCYNAVMTSEAI
jgi:hypothetical protein